MFLKPLTKLPSHKSFNYQPRYYDPEKEARRHRINERIKIEKGAMYNQPGNRLVGAFKKQSIAHRSKNNFNARTLRSFLLIAMFGVITLYYLDEINGIFAAVASAILLIIFIQRTSKA